MEILQVKNKNLSSWADVFDYDEIKSEVDQYNLSIDLLEEAREVLNRSSGRVSKQNKIIKHKKECWQ